MALRSTVYKAELQVSDMDRHHYGTHVLTIARHPSETEERMMVRVLAFAMHADEALEFGRGLSTEDEPDLWLRDLTGAVQLWIDVGLPDEKWLRKACGRSPRVVALIYGGAKADVWWSQNAAALARLDNLEVVAIPQPQSLALAKLAGRSMTLNCTIQDGEIWFGSEADSVQVSPIRLKRPGRDS